MSADSKVQALTLDDGSMLVAYNNATVRGHRHTLHLSRSHDEGRSWQLVAVLKEAKVTHACHVAPGAA
jgi:hypothetical protein